VKKLLLLLPILVCILVFPSKVNAFTVASDTITTSRPSAVTPLNGNLSASSTVVTVYDNNSIFLASDSAKFWGQTQETLTVASASADRTKIYLTSATANAHTNGTVVANAVTAKHTVAFKLSTPAVSGDKLVITFPGSADNTASPSASTFAFNNLQSGNVSISGTTCSGWSISSPSITCTLNAAVDIATTITITIGSSTPALINPTKTQSIGTGDLWKLTLKHTDTSDVIKEANGKIAITTIESVFVQGIVDASITMTIAGINNGTVIKDDNTGCNATGFNITTNSGQHPTATGVNLGTISTGINYVGQKITISTNAPNGYALTATSSGKLKDPATGYFFANAQTNGTDLTANNTPAPAALAGGTTAFGISACGADANTSLFGTTTAYFGNPSNSAGNAYTYSLASNTGVVSSKATSIVYGVTAAATVPAGTYSTVLTYVATPTF
jgi:hypothetical protein